MVRAGEDVGQQGSVVSGRDAGVFIKNSEFMLHSDELNPFRREVSD